MRSAHGLVERDLNASTFAGTSEMAERCRDVDWSATPLGRVEDWPISLRTTCALVLTSPFPMMLMWGRMCVQIYNDGYRVLMGDKHPAGLALSAQECSPDSWSVNAPLYERTMKGEHIVDGEASYPRAGVEGDAWFARQYSPVNDDEGMIAGILVSALETTPQVLSVRKAEVASRAKADFLAVMSHELRTPLNAIGGYAELLALGVRGSITPEQKHDLGRIQQSQRHLLDIINGVLNYAKLEAGVVHYAVEDVSMNELLARCEALVASQVREKQIVLQHTTTGTPLTARADGDKVQEIVLNLLSNAIKFTERGGGVTLSCAARENKRLIVCVSDTGAGIAGADLECVFLPFVQVDSKITRAQEGTGLGLAISRDLARGMGGDLTVESTIGEGSVFTLTLACGRGDMRTTSSGRT